MKIRQLIMLVQALCICVLFQATAQNDGTLGPPKIEITAGVAFSGPAYRMKNQFRNQGFDYLSPGFIFGPIQYPVVFAPGTSLSLGYSWAIKPQQRIGVEINHASLGETVGVNGEGESSNLEFATQGLGVYYSYTTRPFIFKIGPQININKVYSLENFEEDRNKVSNTLSAGLKLAMELYFWNKKVTFAKLGVNYVASYATEHGPYPFEDNSGSLESSKLNFSYGSVYLGFGINL